VSLYDYATGAQRWSVPLPAADGTPTGWSTRLVDDVQVLVDTSYDVGDRT
jgi:hypothetical protein